MRDLLDLEAEVRKLRESVEKKLLELADEKGFSEYIYRYLVVYLVRLLLDDLQFRSTGDAVRDLIKRKEVR
jgi:hypothetical protein